MAGCDSTWLWVNVYMAANPERGPVGARECFSALVQWRDASVAEFTESTEYRECWRTTQCSSSNPLTPAVWPRLQHNYQSLKLHVRSGVGPSTRKEFWLGQLLVTEDDSVLFAKAFGEPVDDQPEQIASVFGWPFSRNCLPSYHLKPASDPAYQRVLTALSYANPHISSCPLLPPLLHVMLHFIEEYECFAALHHLLQRKAWLDQDARQVQASLATLRALGYTRIRATFHDLHRLKPSGMSDEHFLRQLIQHWYTWPFYQQPFWITVRVVDLYLMEGPKVFYRLALAALKLFTAHTQATSLVGTDITEAVQQFTSAMSTELRMQWFQEAFAIRRLPWNTVLKQWSTLLGKIPPHNGEDHVDMPLPMPNYERSVVADPTSEIIPSSELWQVLWAWMPEWMTCETPDCVFRASRDGYNLRTLYRKCEDIQPILLIVRTTKSQVERWSGLMEDSSPNVFGAFIASELLERHQSQFFGTGETFLFRLLPEACCYCWSGETDLILRGTEQEFLVGSGGGAFGLWLDGELDKGITDTCMAFQNSPLTGSETHFACAAVEVYSCDTCT